MRCTKHGCVITETITDDVFCGVCRTAALRADLEYHTDQINRLARAVGALGETSEAVVTAAINRLSFPTPDALKGS
jgi:hypothetical protein